MSRGDAGLGVTSIKLVYGARGGVQTGTWAPGPWFCHLTAMRPPASHLTSLPCCLLSVKGDINADPTVEVRGKRRGRGHEALQTGVYGCFRGFCSLSHALWNEIHLRMWRKP